MKKRMPCLFKHDKVWRKLAVSMLIFAISLAPVLPTLAIGKSETYSDTLQVSRNAKAILEKRANRVTQEQREAAAKAVQTKAKKSGGVGAFAMPAAPVPGGKPNYFGPERNWINSPLPVSAAQVSITGGGGTGATVAATVVNGTVTALALVNGGTGYTSAPSVLITGGTGIGASATAAITGSVANILITNAGTGYIAPVVGITGGGGAGAAADATLDLKGGIASIIITNGGMGYSFVPTVTITDSMGFGTGATAAAIITGPVTSVNLVNGGTGYLSGGIRKFIDTLPGLGATNANNLGQYIPVAVPDTTSFPNSDYYQIELREYTEKMHTDLNPTTLRGYVQVKNGADVAPIHYLGPMIVAQKDRPVRIKFINKLLTGAGGNLFLPVDKTVMGAGMGPLGMDVTPGNQMNYTQNRATLHLHGGLSPWISDGTQHQWITPAGENTDYPKGVSVQNVPDMPDPGPGAQTFYYSNQQSARLMFYHDHAYGITRLNVYAGEAAGYLLTDPVEQELINAGIIPADQIPLIIQDKTFLPDAATVAAEDPTWPFAVNAAKSDLWYPHVYMPNQNPNDPTGINPLGRWDYGPWFWPPWPVTNPPVTLPDGTIAPGVPDLSAVMEAFMDTPVVNGTAYPALDVQPKAYRFRILNASDDRFWNLQIYEADPTVTIGPGAGKEVKMIPADTAYAWPAGWPTPDMRDGGLPDPVLRGPNMIQIGNEGGFLPAPVVFPNIPIGYDMDPKSMTVGNIKEHNIFLGPAERADVVIDFSQYAGKTLILYNDAPAATPATDVRLDYYTGNLDYTATGGTKPTLAGYGPNTRTVMQIRVANLTPAPAYNVNNLNAAFASTVTTQGVFARSAVPIIVPQAGYNSAFNSSFPSDNTAYARIQDTSQTFTPMGATAPLTIPFKPKAIAEEFENDYGRMSAFLGVEVPFTNGMNQTTIFYTVKDPATEIITDSITPMSPVAGDGTQLWKITHNGVDTHPIHFHLFDVQLVNRVDWAGVVKPPEPNELGWKETVRMNPLEDVIVALRPVAPKVPFGQPDSIRPLNPTMPIGDTSGFKNVDPNGDPIIVTNQMTNFGNEYVWHCHILAHEEMDMMRPIQFSVASILPTSPLVNFQRAGGTVNLSWIDGTPFDYLSGAPSSTLGNSSNEVGFRVLRAPVDAMGQPGAYSQIGSALANQTAYLDNLAGISDWSYKVEAFNAAGSSQSLPITSPGAGVVCQTGADINGDGNISNFEILNYIGGWKMGNVSNLSILKAIGFWKAGAGC